MPNDASKVAIPLDFRWPGRRFTYLTNGFSGSNYVSGPNNGGVSEYDI